MPIDSSIIPEVTNENLDACFVEERRGLKRAYQCNICKGFYSKGELKYHFNVHLKVFPFKCLLDSCEKHFSNPRDMRVHMRKVHKKRVIPVKNTESVKRNIVVKREGDQQKIFPVLNVICNVCGKEVRKKHYQEHFRTHNKPDVECTGYENCNEKFKTLLQLTCHIKRIHDPSYNPPPIKKKDCICELCGKSFNKTSLKYHMNEHMGISPYQCNLDECDASFKTPGGLRTHKQWVHMKIRTLRCHYCPTKFNSKEEYETHRLEDCGQKNVSCHICGKVLSRFSLKNHIAIHSGVKSHICPEENCGKAFVRKDKLKQHSISHSKEKMFSCLICSQQFGYKQTLEKHIAKVHASMG